MLADGHEAWPESLQTYHGCLKSINLSVPLRGFASFCATVTVVAGVDNAMDLVSTNRGSWATRSF